MTRSEKQLNSFNIKKAIGNIEQILKIWPYRVEVLAKDVRTDGVYYFIKWKFYFILNTLRNFH